MTAPVRCGRLDEHDPHLWTTPRRYFAGIPIAPIEQTYPGPPVIEGGWAYWDAIDDEFEARVDRERREAVA